jgi:hypothetical protein
MGGQTVRMGYLARTVGLEPENTQRKPRTKATVAKSSARIALGRMMGGWLVVDEGVWVM